MFEPGSNDTLSQNFMKLGLWWLRKTWTDRHTHTQDKCFISIDICDLFQDFILSPYDQEVVKEGHNFRVFGSAKLLELEDQAMCKFLPIVIHVLVNSEGLMNMITVHIAQFPLLMYLATNTTDIMSMEICDFLKNSNKTPGRSSILVQITWNMLE